MVKWVAFMLTVGQEGSPLIEVNVGSDVRAMAFAANGEYLVTVSGDHDGDKVRVWGVEDGKQIYGNNESAGRSTASQCRRTAEPCSSLARHLCGTHRPRVSSLAKSTRLFITPDHNSWVIAAKYSPKGDQIATATRNGSV